MTGKLDQGSEKAGAVVGSRAFRRWTVISVGALLLFWALAWALGPAIFKMEIEKIASAKLGRVVTLGNVDFKPWSLELVVTDLKNFQAKIYRSPAKVQRV